MTTQALAAVTAALPNTMSAPAAARRPVKADRVLSIDGFTEIPHSAVAVRRIYTVTLTLNVDRARTDDVVNTQVDAAVPEIKSLANYIPHSILAPNTPLSLIHI